MRGLITNNEDLIFGFDRFLVEKIELAQGLSLSKCDPLINAILSRKFRHQINAILSRKKLIL